MGDGKEKGKGKEFSSGVGALRLGSGSQRKLFSSGSHAAGDYTEFSGLMIGDEIHDQAPLAFRLAPRIYQLLRADDVPHVSLPSVGLITELPVDLLFHESPPEVRLRQCWFSTSATDWRWQLVIEPQGECISATLMATAPTVRSSQPLVWRSTEIWQPFGADALHLEPATIGAVPLIVRAP